MNFELVYTQRAIKDISRLDPTIKERLGKTLLRYKGDPIKYAENSPIRRSEFLLLPFARNRHCWNQGKS